MRSTLKSPSPCGSRPSAVRRGCGYRTFPTGSGVSEVRAGIRVTTERSPELWPSLRDPVDRVDFGEIYSALKPSVWDSAMHRRGNNRLSADGGKNKSRRKTGDGFLKNENGGRSIKTLKDLCALDSVSTSDASRVLISAHNEAPGGLAYPMMPLWNPPLTHFRSKPVKYSRSP